MRSESRYKHRKQLTVGRETDLFLEPLSFCQISRKAVNDDAKSLLLVWDLVRDDLVEKVVTAYGAQ